MKENSPNKIIVGHLNINSLKNKFEALQFIINRNLDIILLSETKPGESFPSAQFMLKNFKFLIETQMVDDRYSMFVKICPPSS